MNKELLVHHHVLQDTLTLLKVVLVSTLVRSAGQDITAKEMDNHHQLIIVQLVTTAQRVPLIILCTLAVRVTTQMRDKLSAQNAPEVHIQHQQALQLAMNALLVNIVETLE